VSADYYENNTRTQLSFCIIYKENNNIKKMFVDLISHLLDTKCFSSIRGIKFLMKQDFFKRIDKKNYIFWFDCGTHFRCAEMIYFLFSEMQSCEPIKIEANFFAEKHGKNKLDQHFSIQSKFYESAAALKRITNTTDIITVDTHSQARANEFREKRGKEPIINFVLEFLPENTPSLKRTEIKIDDISVYYNFFNDLSDSNKLKSNVLTGYNNIVDILDINNKEYTNKLKWKLTIDNYKPIEKPWNAKQFSMEYLMSSNNLTRLKMKTLEERNLFDKSFNPDESTIPELCAKSYKFSFYLLLKFVINT
jgi:hypothetical protein